MSDKYAVITGSGFHGLASDGESRHVATRFGTPSAAIKMADIEGQPVLTIARHGDDHTIPPHAINYCANLAALQELGATIVIAVNTVGVVTALRQCGEIAVPDQVLDYTWGRAHTIFDGSDGVVEHIDFTRPFSSSLRLALLAAAKSARIDCFDGGVYATMQGPRLEAAAEIDRLERDGADFVGMTAMPEAAIARELGLEYACLSLIVNHAAGRGDNPIHEDVESSTRIATTRALTLLQQLFKEL